MKIALVVTLGGDLVRSTEHVGIGYLAACLRRAKHDVIVIEIKEQEIPNTDSYIPSLKGCDIIGFTTTCVTMKNIIKLTSIVKDMIPNSYILYGGHMATFGGKELLNRYLNIDFVIIGEGEKTIVDLANALENGSDLSNVRGIIYRKNNEIIETESQELIADLDELPFPDRDQFELHNRKFQYLRISSSRGCLGSCGFCSSFVGRKQKGLHWRGRSPKNVVDEIEFLVKKYDFHTYDFVDSTFEDPGIKGKERIKNIAEELIYRNINIYYNCCFRAENWSDADDSLLELLIESGLEKVNIGFESGNDRGLRILNKRATISDNWRVINTLKKHPMIYVTFGFIMLHPYSTLQDIRENAEFLHNTGIGQVIRHYFWMLEIYPGTLLEKKLKEDELLDKEYNIHDGMYKYHFEDPQVSVFVPLFNEMLKLESVWDFEIFDILVHTFITRIIRKYNNTEIYDEIVDFSNFVKQERKKIADYNYNFFIELIEKRENSDVYAMKKALDMFLLDEMNIIKNKQYQFGIALKRKGYLTNLR